MYTPTNRDDSSLAALLPLNSGTADHDLPIRAPLQRLLKWPRGRLVVAAGLAPITIVGPHGARKAALDGLPRFRRLLAHTLGISLGLSLIWLAACAYEWGTGQRILPWDPYTTCDVAQPAVLPTSVRVGLYEEFPTPRRLAQLKFVDFPVTLAVAASSREAFLTLRTTILSQYPQVREVYFWPLLAPREGYYPGTWSDASAVRRVTAESEGLPVLWDLEMPPELAHPSILSWPENRIWLDQWLRARDEPVHIWRSHTSMGLDPLFLRLVSMHFDPLDYPQVSLHLDLYSTGTGRPPEQLARILRCGVERYGPRFIPALGVLDDGHASSDHFVPLETLRRDLKLTRQAGVTEVWLFGVNGLSDAVVKTLHETLPLESEGLKGALPFLKNSPATFEEGRV
jgi:hypothetical protein